jgi:predicted PurR-regulated permease PerM
MGLFYCLQNHLEKRRSMALINCPECNKEISSVVKDCPHCGFPISQKLVKRFNKKHWTIIISILLILLVGITCLIGMNVVKQKRLAEEQARLQAEQKQVEQELISLIEVASDNAYNTCSFLLSVWDNSDSRDFNSVFKYMFSGEIKGKEWSGLGMDKNGFSSISWGSLASEMNNFTNTLNELEKEKNNLDRALQDFKDIKTENTSLIIDYYNCYLSLYSAATSPAGNLLNYSSNLVSMKNSLDSTATKVALLND